MCVNNYDLDEYLMNVVFHSGNVLKFKTQSLCRHDKQNFPY